ncbi:GNVR domain-containing protein [Halioxenophilus aromaticivorans]|uniref:Chain length determinant protein EpsF n=1 Tax=Halioxenophilus aromaticivorans TaxID=1306992 RepID=A0AAV3U140_9ALTE
MNFNILLVIFRARFGLIAFTLALCVVASLVMTILQPKTYEAETSLVLNVSGSTPFEQNSMSAQLTAGYIATQLDIISSQSVALKVVDNLQLENNEELKRALLQDHDGSMLVRDRLANKLSKSLGVEPSRDSRVVNIIFSFTDAEIAAMMANAFADAYIEKNLELNMEPAARSAVWFDDQIKVFRIRLEEAQKRLTDYQQEQGIVMIDERLDTETNRLNELSRSYVDAQADTYDVKSRQLGQNHPEYVRAIKRESSLKASLDDQKKRFLEIKQQRDGLDVLARELDTEQQAYESMLARYYETRLASQFNQTNISILNRATKPVSPSSPNLSVNLISAIMLGGILGAVLAFLVEIFDRRIRAEEDIDELFGAKLLAQV